MPRLLTLTPRYAGLYLTAINLVLVAGLVGLDPDAVADMAEDVVPPAAARQTSGGLVPISELCQPCTRLVQDVIAFDRRITAEAAAVVGTLLPAAGRDPQPGAGLAAADNSDQEGPAQ
ncbi:hypothetical protein GWI72_08415 [Microvirga tunisiensis]|uniref:Uncharacterized protein n=1 Tax=Pannonibacter tanglangensis TaxID=2750084 RepID=A0A7X5J884_9HYPH|nr:hypothetical protein [Pannonibacter sp. XCT-53]NBN78287.1 hypothetical protein [Pannonibacter sp. XCT-53]